MTWFFGAGIGLIVGLYVGIEYTGRAIELAIKKADISSASKKLIREVLGITQ